MIRALTVSAIALALTTACAGGPAGDARTSTVAGATPRAGDAHWPQWRGPAATGVSATATPPVTWSETDNVRFKVMLPGAGLSTPIVWGDRLYLTAAVETDAEADPEARAAADERMADWMRESGQGVVPDRVVRFVVMALDRHDGSVVWERAVNELTPHEGTHTDATWASASCATDGRVLVAHFGSYGTYGMDLDGEVLWERDLGDMRTRNGFGEGSSPYLHDDRIVINWDHEDDSFIEVLDRDTGETVWRKDRDEVTSWATPVVVAHDGVEQVVINATTATRGYDLATGEVLWEAGGMTVNTIPSPVHADGRVYVMSGFRGAMAQAIDLASRGDVTGSVAWSHERDTPYVPSPLLSDGRLYFLKGNKAILSVLDATTGEPLAPLRRLDDVDGVYAAPVAADGRVYVVGRDGTTAVLEDGGEFATLATNALDDRFDASPALAGDTLYLRGRAALYALAEDGEAGAD